MTTPGATFFSATCHFRLKDHSTTKQVRIQRNCIETLREDILTAYAGLLVAQGFSSSAIVLENFVLVPVPYHLIQVAQQQEGSFDSNTRSRNLLRRYEWSVTARQGSLCLAQSQPEYVFTPTEAQARLREVRRYQ
jgi:hypothetical protein